MTPKEAKKGKCCAIRTDNRKACGEDAILTLRLDSEGGPNFFTFCWGHLHRAPMVIDKLEADWKPERLP